MKECFRLPSYSLRYPVQTVPLSKDETDCMREAQYLSAVGSQPPLQTQNAPSQLDPGSLYDTSRRGGGGSNGRSATTRSSGANSLLKQAIANRLKPSESNALGGSTVGASGSTKDPQSSPEDKSSDEGMSKSIVMNPAWYRDHEGRTGYKTKEWEDLPNLQKEQVKAKRKAGEQKTSDKPSLVDKIDQELLSKNEEKQRLEAEEAKKEDKKEKRSKRSKERNAEEKLEEALESLEQAVEKDQDQEDKKKLSKDEKKALKEKEKEEKKEKEERLKDEKRLAKEKKKKEKEQEKEEKKKLKSDKKNKSQTSLNKSEDEPVIEENLKKEKGSSSKSKSEKGESIEKSSSTRSTEEKLGKGDKSKISEKNKAKDSEGMEKPAKKSSGKEEKKTKDDSKVDKSEKEKGKSPDKKENDKKSSADNEKKKSIPESSATSSSSKKTKVSVSRRESNDSLASSTKSTNTVREVDTTSAVSPKTHRKPPSGRVSLSSPQTSSSSPEDEKIMASTSRTVSRDRRPKKETIGERRDSSVSESSRISGVSHKSVTFSDRIQTHEIERIEFSSSDDDVAVMSDDEMSKPDPEKRRRLIHLLQKQSSTERSDLSRPQSLAMYNEDADFEEQERLIEEMMKMEQIPHGYPIYDLENTSEQGFFGEDEQELPPGGYVLDEEGSYISLDHLPSTVRQAIVAEMKQKDYGIRDMDCLPLGSMTKLHDPGSNTPSLLSYPTTLPRSASGYLEQDHEMMNTSYQQAMYTTAFHHSVPDNPQPFENQSNISEFDRQRRLQESFYDNVHGMPPSRTSSLLGATSSNAAPSTTERRSSDGVVAFSNLPAVSQSPIPTEPTKRNSNTSLDRAAFFANMSSPTSSPTPKKISGSKEVVSPVTREHKPQQEHFQSHQQEQQVQKTDEHQTPTPSPPRMVSAPQRVVVTSTTTTTTNRTEIVEKTEGKKKDENAMKKQFIAKFGTRRAPIAEEDPTDPVQPMGSQESVLSTDSRESVVSAASIRTESNIRRNFNY